MMKYSLYNLFYRYSLSLLLFLCFPCFANPPHSIEIATAQLVEISKELIAGKKMTQKELDRGVSIARNRRNEILTTLQSNPNSLIPFMLSASIAQVFPREIKPFIEETITNIEGQLEIRAVCYTNSAENIKYLLRKDDGTIYSIYFYDELPKNLKTGARIRLKQAIKVPRSDRDNELLVSIHNYVLVTDADVNAIPSSLGTQNTLFFLVNFQNQPTNRPWTNAQISAVASTVNNMFFESSYRQTTVAANIVGWYTIALNSNFDCRSMSNIDAIMNMAVNAALRSGVNVGAYPRRIFMFPNNPGCGWAGLGTIGGNPSNSWLNGYNLAYITAHEMGHNFGLFHSRFLKCTNSPNQGNCSVLEYGDEADVMGNGNTSHFNAFQKDRLGWLNYQNSPPITTITNSGTYLIHSYELTTPNAKALKILKKTNTNGSRDYYYMEYRQGLGFDNVLASCSNCDFTKGILIHQGNDIDANSSNLLDMTPLDNSIRFAALLPGKTFSDPTADNGRGVNITLNVIGGGYANVTVTFGNTPPPPTCIRNNPTMTISPNTTQWVRAGSAANYLITLQNNDTESCPPSVFNLTKIVGEVCLRATLSSSTLTLRPRMSSQVNLNLLSSNIASSGVYNVIVQARNSGIPNQIATVPASLGVVGTARK